MRAITSVMAYFVFWMLQVTIQIKCVKITYISSIWYQTFANLAVV